MTDEKRLKEFREKRQRIAGILKSRALEGLYLKRQDNFAWATAGGTNTVGVTGDPGVAGLLFTSRGDFVLCSNIEAHRMQEEEALEDFGFKIHTWVWLENREKQILQEILDGGALGADFALAGAENLAAEIASLRYSLTEDEANRYRQLGYDVSLALETAAAGIRPGDRECEVTGRLSSMLWKNRIDIVTTFCAADERIVKYRHPVTTKKTISQRAMLGVNARRGGLIVCLTRFVQFGGVPEKLARQYRDNVEIDNVFMSQTRLADRWLKYWKPEWKPTAGLAIPVSISFIIRVEQSATGAGTTGWIFPAPKLCRTVNPSAGILQ